MNGQKISWINGLNDYQPVSIGYQKNGSWIQSLIIDQFFFLSLSHQLLIQLFTLQLSIYYIFIIQKKKIFSCTMNVQSHSLNSYLMFKWKNFMEIFKIIIIIISIINKRCRRHDRKNDDDDDCPWPSFFSFIHSIQFYNWIWSSSSLNHYWIIKTLFISRFVCFFP